MSCLGPERRPVACLAALLLGVLVLPLATADKPAVTEKTLQQQRLDVLREAVKMRQKEIDAGRATSKDLLGPSRRLFLAELETTAKPADRLKLCDGFARLVKDVQEVHEALHQAARITDAEYALARASSLEDEAFLLRERLRGKEDKEGAEKLRKLRLERREACQAALLALSEQFEAGRCSLKTIMGGRRQALNADLDVEEKPAARCALHQEHVDWLAKMEEVVRKWVKDGRASDAECAAMRAARLTAEVDLQREKSGPRAERLATFRRLLEERRDAARTALKLGQEHYDFLKRHVSVLHNDFLPETRAVLDAELALADKAADRVAPLRGFLDKVKKIEEEARVSAEAGRSPRIEWLNARAARLEAEINLLRAQRGVK